MDGNRKIATIGDEVKIMRVYCKWYPCQSH